ncbi:AraC family transcriptional regulator ligand-binding domain-containing protein [Actinacidiphila guanduensis]|uniref:AraC-type DNA-binding protein n=1 Tax=Actinacidiphila guanduensis TaxID=310781 RepID=A0A1H0HSQ1_9ACTN|nr:AraC family transcriptional regulator ligand-binding domain-containing protein [Actinacidiphila guanduensis]SDO22196.1 AraC-type DNA-binding protein [Actinacidiphila guanduensis]
MLAAPTPAPAPPPPPDDGRDAGGRPGPVPALTESVVVPRLIALGASTGPAEAHGLVRAAGLPHALSAPETVRTPSAATYRLWGAVLARTGRRDAGLLAARGYRPGMLDVFDYLIGTAPTVGEGLARAAAHIHLVSSNSLLTVAEDGDEVRIGYGVHRGDGELRGVVAEFSLAVLTSVLRCATAGELTPLRADFTHRAPLRTSGYAEAFGGARIGFGAPADTITLRRDDLERPLATADPALAAIMLRAAAATPAPALAQDGPVPGLRAVIAAQLPCGRPSLADAARCLAISPRTLQRRLGEAGTTWRAELDEVRRERFGGLREQGAGSAERAARLGFAESRSLRRAMSRWDTARGTDEGRRTSGAGQEAGTPMTTCDPGQPVRPARTKRANEERGGHEEFGTDAGPAARRRTGPAEQAASGRTPRPAESLGGHEQFGQPLQPGPGGTGRSADPRTAPAGESRRGHQEFSEGGEPACWLDRVCEECGAFRETPAPVCARCGTPFPGAAGRLTEFQEPPGHGSSAPEGER